MIQNQKTPIIFFGNGKLADFALNKLQNHCEIVFHARTKSDLAQVYELKKAANDEGRPLFGILASYGRILKPDLLDLFESTGILNLHPSLLPKYRGPAPIEAAILAGETKFGVSIMKIAAEMDAGPIFYQTEKTFEENVSKETLYRELAELGAEWLVQNLQSLPEPKPQNHAKATYTKKLGTAQAHLDTENKTAQQLMLEIRAFADFPKSRLEVFGKDCIIKQAHALKLGEMPAAQDLYFPCKDNTTLVIDILQPAGKKAMSAAAFLNGYTPKAPKF